METEIARFGQAVSPEAQKRLIRAAAESKADGFWFFGKYFDSPSDAIASSQREPIYIRRKQADSAQPGFYPDRPGPTLAGSDPQPPSFTVDPPSPINVGDKHSLPVLGIGEGSGGSCKLEKFNLQKKLDRHAYF